MPVSSCPRVRCSPGRCLDPLCPTGRRGARLGLDLGELDKPAWCFGTIPRADFTSPAAWIRNTRSPRSSGTGRAGVTTTRPARPGLSPAAHPGMNRCTGEPAGGPAWTQRIPGFLDNAGIDVPLRPRRFAMANGEANESHELQSSAF